MIDGIEPRRRKAINEHMRRRPNAHGRSRNRLCPMRERRAAGNAMPSACKAEALDLANKGSVGSDLRHPDAPLSLSDDSAKVWALLWHTDLASRSIASGANGHDPAPFQCRSAMAENAGSSAQALLATRQREFRSMQSMAPDLHIAGRSGVEILSVCERRRLWPRRTWT